MTPSRRSFLRGLLSIGGTAAVLPALTGPERLHTDEVLMDIHGRRSVLVNGQCWEYDLTPVVHDSALVLARREPSAAETWMLEAIRQEGINWGRLAAFDTATVPYGSLERGGSNR